MFKLVLASLVVVLLSLNASATKERGGGNSTPTGEIGESGLASDSTVLSVTELRTLLLPYAAKVGRELPGLVADLLFTNDERTSWFLNSKLNTAGCEFKSAADIQTQTIACQTIDTEGLSEVRIARSYWAKASTQQRSDLVLHERLRNILSYRGRASCEDCLYRAVQAFKAPTSALFILNLQRSLKLNHIGSYLTLIEQQQVLTLSARRLHAACLTTSDSQFRSSFDGRADFATVSFNALKALEHVLWVTQSNDRSQCSDVEAAVALNLTTWPRRN